MISNAQTFSEVLTSQGVRVVSGGTDNHLFLIDVAKSYRIGGKLAEEVLEKAGISVNKNMIPADERKPLDPSGIRIGTPAVTTRGMGAPEMRKIAYIIHTLLSHPENQEAIVSAKGEIAELCRRFPIYKTLPVWTR